MTLNGNSAIAVVDNDYAVSVANHKSVWNWVSNIRKEGSMRPQERMD